MTRKLDPPLGNQKLRGITALLLSIKKKKTAAKTYVINASLFFIAPEIRKRRISKNDI